MVNFNMRANVDNQLAQKYPTDITVCLYEVSRATIYKNKTVATINECGIVDNAQADNDTHIFNPKQQLL